MKFERNPYRELPDKSIRKVFPFHVSMEGAKTRVLCREDADYDLFVKTVVLCALRKNVVLVAYSVVSNHFHSVILATDIQSSDAFGEEVKKIYSMFFSRKYNDKSAMRTLSVKSILIDSDWYLRNAIAYDFRNAADNGVGNISEYKWSSYRSAFCYNHSISSPIRGKETDQPGKQGGFGLIPVKDLSKRQKREILHTNTDLSEVGWLLNKNHELEPESACDWRYLEAAFLNDQFFFMKQMGSVNTAEMKEKLVDGPRKMKTDAEFVRQINDVSNRWFGQDIHSLPLQKKVRMIIYADRTMKTNVPQLARTFELDRENIVQILTSR